MKLSSKLMEYNFFVKSFVPYVTSAANIIRYGLTPEDVTALTDFLTDWNTKFAAYSNPLTNNEATTLDANEAYLIGFPLTEGVRSSIKARTTLVLSGAEREVLDIKKPSPRRGRVPAQEEGPILACIARNANSLSFMAIDPLSPRKFGKPKNMDIGLSVAYTAVDAPLPPPEAFLRLRDETAAEFELIVSGDNLGKIMSLKGSYVNPRGEAGSFGRTYMMVI